MRRKDLITVLAGFVLGGCASHGPSKVDNLTTVDRSDAQAEAIVLKLIADLNAAVIAGDASGVRRLMYVPENDYDFSDTQRYLQRVAAGQFKTSHLAVLHAEVEGNYAAVIIQQKPAGEALGEMTPVALYKPGVRWRILPFDLPKNHAELGGETAAAAYARILARTDNWVRKHANAKQ